MAGKSSILLFVMLFGLSLPLQVFADRSPITLESALKLVAEKKYDQARTVYEEWLKANPADPRLFDVLLRCGELTKNAFHSIELFETYLPKINDAVKKTELQKQIALLYVMLGDYSSARTWYERAFTDIPRFQNDPCILEPARLALITGDTEGALSWVKNAYPVIKTTSLKLEAMYLLLEIALVRDDIAYALDLVGLIRKDDTRFEVFPRVLYRMVLYYFVKKETDKAKLFFQELEKSFPGSPEFPAASGIISGKVTQVQALSLPYEILGTSPVKLPDTPVAGNEVPRATNPPVAPAVPAASGAPKGVRIQIGSYTMLENAQYALRDAEKIGVRGEIVKKDIRGTVYYRVIVGQNLTEDAAQKMLAALADAGFSGILYTEDN